MGLSARNNPATAQSLALLALGAAAMWLLLTVRGCIAGDPEPAYTDVVVDSTAIVEGEPDTDVGRLESITRPAAVAEVSATAPGAARGNVAAFCRSAGWQPPGSSTETVAQRTTTGGPDRGARSPAPDPEDSTAPTPSVPAPAVDLTGDSLPGVPPPASGLPSVRTRLLPDPVLLARSGVFDGRRLDLRLVSSAGALIHRRWPCRAPCSFRVDGAAVVVQGSRWPVIRGYLAIGAGLSAIVFASQARSELVRTGGIAVGSGFVGWGLGEVR